MSQLYARLGESDIEVLGEICFDWEEKLLKTAQQRQLSKSLDECRTPLLFSPRVVANSRFKYASASIALATGNSTPASNCNTTINKFVMNLMNVNDTNYSWTSSLATTPADRILAEITTPVELSSSALAAKPHNISEAHVIADKCSKVAPRVLFSPSCNNTSGKPLLSCDLTCMESFTSLNNSVTDGQYDQKLSSFSHQFDSSVVDADGSDVVFQKCTSINKEEIGIAVMGGTNVAPVTDSMAPSKRAESFAQGHSVESLSSGKAVHEPRVGTSSFFDDSGTSPCLTGPGVASVLPKSALSFNDDELSAFFVSPVGSNTSLKRKRRAAPKRKVCRRNTTNESFETAAELSILSVVKENAPAADWSKMQVEADDAGISARSHNAPLKLDSMKNGGPSTSIKQTADGEEESVVGARSSGLQAVQSTTSKTGPLQSASLVSCNSLHSVGNGRGSVGSSAQRSPPSVLPPLTGTSCKTAVECIQQSAATPVAACSPSNRTNYVNTSTPKLPAAMRKLPSPTVTPLLASGFPKKRSEVDSCTAANSNAERRSPVGCDVPLPITEDDPPANDVIQSSSTQNSVHLNRTPTTLSRTPFSSRITRGLLLTSPVSNAVTSGNPASCALMSSAVQLQAPDGSVRCSGNESSRSESTSQNSAVGQPAVYGKPELAGSILLKRKRRFVYPNASQIARDCPRRVFCFDKTAGSPSCSPCLSDVRTTSVQNEAAVIGLPSSSGWTLPDHDKTTVAREPGTNSASFKTDKPSFKEAELVSGRNSSQRSSRTVRSYDRRAADHRNVQQSVALLPQKADILACPSSFAESTRFENCIEVCRNKAEVPDSGCRQTKSLADNLSVVENARTRMHVDNSIGSNYHADKRGGATSSEGNLAKPCSATSESIDSQWRRELYDEFRTDGDFGDIPLCSVSTSQTAKSVEKNNCSVDISDAPKPADMVTMSVGFKSAGGKQITVSEASKRKACRLIDEAMAESGLSDDVSAFAGSGTRDLSSPRTSAAGSGTSTVKTKSEPKCEKLTDGASLRCKGNRLTTRFTVAEQITSSVVAGSVLPVSETGFKSASGRQVTVRKENLTKAKSVMDEIALEVRHSFEVEGSKLEPMELVENSASSVVAGSVLPVSETGFKSASGRQVTVRKENLTKAKSVMDEIAMEVEQRFEMEDLNLEPVKPIEYSEKTSLSSHSRNERMSNGFRPFRTPRPLKSTSSNRSVVRSALLTLNEASTPHASQGQGQRESGCDLATELTCTQQAEVDSVSLMAIQQADLFSSQAMSFERDANVEEMTGRVENDICFEPACGTKCKSPVEAVPSAAAVDLVFASWDKDDWHDVDDTEIFIRSVQLVSDKLGDGCVLNVAREESGKLNGNGRAGESNVNQLVGDDVTNAVSGRNNPPIFAASGCAEDDRSRIGRRGGTDVVSRDSQDCFSMSGSSVGSQTKTSDTVSSKSAAAAAVAVVADDAVSVAQIDDNENWNSSSEAYIHDAELSKAVELVQCSASSGNGDVNGNISSQHSTKTVDGQLAEEICSDQRCLSGTFGGRSDAYDTLLTLCDFRPQDICNDGSGGCEKKSEFSSRTCMFSTARGQPVEVSKDALLKARQMLEGVDDGDDSTGVKRAKSCSSEVSLQSRQLSGDDGRRCDAREGNSSHAESKSYVKGSCVETNPLPAAGGSRELEIMAEAEENAEEMIDDLDGVPACESNLVRTGNTMFQTAGGRTVDVSREALAKARKMLQEDTESTDAAIRGSSLFQTASGRAVGVSAEAVSKARKILQDVYSHEVTELPEARRAAGNRVDFDVAVTAARSGFHSGSSLFQTAGGKSVKISDEALSKAKAILQEALGEDGEDIGSAVNRFHGKASSFGTSLFQTASGQSVNISDEALVKARKLLQNDSGENGVTFSGERMDAKRFSSQIMEEDRNLASCSKTPYKQQESTGSCVVGSKSNASSYVPSFKVGTRRGSADGSSFEASNCQSVHGDEESLAMNCQHSSQTGGSGQNEIAVGPNSSNQSRQIERNLSRQFQRTLGNDTSTGRDASAVFSDDNQLRLSKDCVSDRQRCQRALVTSPESFVGDRTALKPLRSYSSVDVTGQQGPDDVSRERPTKTEADANEQSRKAVVCHFITPFKKMSADKANMNATTPFKKMSADMNATTPSAAVVKQVQARVPLFSRQACLSAKDEQESPSGFATVESRGVSSKQDVGQLQSRRCGPEVVGTSGSLGKSNFVTSCISETDDKVTIADDSLTSCDVTSLGRRKARQQQLDRIAARQNFPSSDVTVLAGTYFITRQQADKRRRISLKQAVDGLRPVRYSSLELHACGVSTETISVTAANAVDFQFRACDSRDVTIRIGDGALLVFNESGLAGKHEFYNALRDMRGIVPSLVSADWVYNHYRWIVWKLAALERSFPRHFGGRCLSAHEVMLQLKYRYDVEIDHSKRSTLKKIYEQDDTPRKSMVLCVCAVHGENVIELTDGWYSIKAALDCALSRLVKKQVISIGDKLYIYGAELTGSKEACTPLEGFGSTMLKLFANSTRRALWNAKLGFQRSSRPPVVPVSSLFADGGPVGGVDVVVSRIYPVQFLEKLPDGGTVIRNEVAESRAVKMYEQRRQTAVETLYSKLQQEEPRQRSLTKPKSKSPLACVSSTSSIDDIYDAFMAASDPETFQLNLNPTQLQALNKHIEAVQQRHNIELEDRLQAQLAELDSKMIQRNVTPMIKVQVVGCSSADVDSRTKTTLTVWKPTEEVLQLLKEGVRLMVFNLIARNSSGWRSVSLSSTRQTRYEPVPVDENLLALVYEPRQAVTFCDVVHEQQQHSGTHVEIDTVGLLVEIKESYSAARSTLSTVYLSDNEEKFLSVKFFGKLETYGVDSLFKPGVVIACCNLQCRPRQSDARLPCVVATELSAFFSRAVPLHLQRDFNLLQSKLKTSVGLLKSLQQKLDVVLTSTTAKALDTQDNIQPLFDIISNVSDVSDAAPVFNLSQVSSAGGLKLGLHRPQNRHASGNQSLNDTNCDNIVAVDCNSTFEDAMINPSPISPTDATAVSGSQTSSKRRHRLGNGHGGCSSAKKSARLMNSSQDRE